MAPMLPRPQRDIRRRLRSSLAFVLAAAVGALLALGPAASLAEEKGGGATTDGTTTPPGSTSTGGSTSTTGSSTASPTTTTQPTTTTRPRPRPPRPTTTTLPRVTTTVRVPSRRPRPKPAPKASPAPMAVPAPPAPGNPGTTATAGEDSSFGSSGSAPSGASVSFITPFPVVRIAGSLTRGGVRIRLLTVRAPVGTTVAARCLGEGCPRALARRALSLRVARSGRPVRLKAMQRGFRSGVRLEIHVSRSGLYGKYTRFRIRRGQAPARTDMCLSPTAAARPARCPGAR